MCLCWLLYYTLLFLFLYAMKACGGAEVLKNSFLTSALNSGEWRASSRLGRPAARSKISRWPFNRRLAGYQSPSGPSGEEDNIMTLARMQSVCCTKQRRWYTVTRITVRIAYFVEPGGLVSSSAQSTVGPSLETHEQIPHHHQLSF
jgi:hypothetical protein